MNNYIIFDRTTFDNMFVHIYEIAFNIYFVNNTYLYLL